MSSKVNTLTPTDGIKDPQVRAFCESLSNVWQLRNGNIGADDKERFITKQEWDFLAKNPNIRAIAGIGQPGSSPTDPGGDPRGPGGPPTVIPDWIQNLLDFLASGITLIDFSDIRKTSNELYANYFALVGEFRSEMNVVSQVISDLQNDITQINFIDKDSTSASALALWGLKEQVNDPATGLEQAHAAIVEINKMDVTSTSANAQRTLALEASVNNANNSNLANTAAIIAINTVDVNSSSASAKQLAGLSASVGYDKVKGTAQVTADITAINFVDANSASANARATAGLSAKYDSNLALINAINTVDANSSSANARQLAGVTAYAGLKGRTFAQSTPPVSNASYTLVKGDLWINTLNLANTLMIWDGTAWQDASDKRISDSSAGVANEATARASSDSALAQQLNKIWAEVGNANGLVFDQAGKVTVNNNAGSADKFTQVQVAVKDPVTGQTATSSILSTFNTYTNNADKISNASYSLIVQAQNGGGKAVAGMTITANVKPQPSQPESAVIFLADQFLIYNSATTNRAEAPFVVSGNVVRLNVAHVKDYIQSDLFVRPAEHNPNYPAGKGWRINANGDAEFYGSFTAAEIIAGSTLTDPYSDATLGSTAVSIWSSTMQRGKTQLWDPKNRLYGPNYHSGVAQYQRIRSGDASHQLLSTLMFVGIADHYVSIWRRANGTGPWILCNKTATPSPDYNACTCAWVSTLTCGVGDYWDFAVSPTDENLKTIDDGPYDELRQFSLIATMQNI